MGELACADARDQLAVGVEEVLLRDANGDVLRGGVVVEEIGGRDDVGALVFVAIFAVLRGEGGCFVVEVLDFRVDFGGLARHGFEHGVAAEGVEVGASVGVRELLGDGAEGDAGVESESGIVLAFSFSRGD